MLNVILETCAGTLTQGLIYAILSYGTAQHQIMITGCCNFHRSFCHALSFHFRKICYLIPFP